MPINDVNPQPPYAGPPAIAIGTNGFGINPLFDRLLFNVSEDYGYTIDPNITKVVGNHTFKAGARLEDHGDRIAALWPVHHGVRFQ